MVINVTNIQNYLNKGVYDEALLLSSLSDIFKLVLHRHFSSYVHMEDDLSSLSLEKAMLMLRRRDVDQGNLVNFLYTGMRNSIGNEIKKKRKYICFDTTEYLSNTAEDSMDLCLCDLRDAVSRKALCMANRVRVLGFDTRRQVTSFLKGRSTHKLSYTLVKVAALKVLLER